MSRAESPQTEYNGTKLFISFYITNFEFVFLRKYSPLIRWILMILMFVSGHLFGVKIIKRAVHGLLQKWEGGGNGRCGFAVS